MTTKKTPSGTDDRVTDLSTATPLQKEFPASCKGPSGTQKMLNCSACLAAFFKLLREMEIAEWAPLLEPDSDPSAQGNDDSKTKQDDGGHDDQG